jgi:hypothetical protein
MRKGVILLAQWVHPQHAWSTPDPSRIQHSSRNQPPTRERNPPKLSGNDIDGHTCEETEAEARERPHA